MSVFAVVEGDTDEPIVRKLLRAVGLDVAIVYDMGGKGQLDKKLGGFNSSAKGSPWFVLRDLDHDAACAPEFLRDISFAAERWMVFRLAVRELEAWLLADREALARFLGLSPAWLPDHPDDEVDPTQTLIDLARRSRRSAIRRAFVPRPGDSVSVGPGYEGAIIEFGIRHWNLRRAERLSPSLRRAHTAVRLLARAWSRHVHGDAGRAAGRR